MPKENAYQFSGLLHGYQNPRCTEGAKLKSTPVVWPENQKVDPLASDPEIAFTYFADYADYHSSLIDKILKLEQSKKHAERRQRGFCGTKILNLADWKIPEATLINQRALEFFKQVTGSEHAEIDDSWGNIYRAKDYCMPHSHIRATAGIVYFLDPGDEDPDDQISGRFYIADPRIKHCNAHHPGHMTRMLLPIAEPGSMAIFPGSVVHGVNPYFGKKPRITLAWNINVQKLPGDSESTFHKK